MAFTCKGTHADRTRRDQHHSAGRRRARAAAHLHAHRARAAVRHRSRRPKTRTVNQLTEERMVVTIDHDQNVFLQDKPVNVNELPARSAQSARSRSAKRIIYLRADERVPFGAFASVMDAVKQAGITNISIVTRPIENK